MQEALAEQIRSVLMEFMRAGNTVETMNAAARLVNHLDVVFLDRPPTFGVEIAPVQCLKCISHNQTNAIRMAAE